MEVILTIVLAITFGMGLFALLFVLNRLYRRPMLSDFVGRRRSVFITGTDTGFGHELALTLDRLGVAVYAGCLTDEGERSLHAASSSGGLLKTLRVDVTDAESVLKAKQFIEDDLRDAGVDGLWGLVNNAGIARGHIFHYSTLADYRFVMDVNFFGVVQVTEAFLPLVIKTRGRIVNVISILSRCTGIAEPYACSKFALQPYNDGLRRYLATFGGHVAAIEPGFFQTKLVDKERLMSGMDRSWAELPSDMRQLYGQEFHEIARNTVTSLTNEPPLANFNRVSMVIGSIVHALSARYPKSRYIVGLDARFVYLPIGLMPDWFNDYSCRFMLPFHGVLARRLADLQQSKSNGDASNKEL